MRVLLITWLLRVVGRLDRKKVIHSRLVAVVTPTDRTNWVHNRYVFEVFGGVFMLSLCALEFSVGIGAFVTGLSQISSFVSHGIINDVIFAIIHSL